MDKHTIRRFLLQRSSQLNSALKYEILGSFSSKQSKGGNFIKRVDAAYIHLLIDRLHE